MYFIKAAVMLLSAALMGTALGSSVGAPVERNGTWYSPEEYSFLELADGRLQITPLHAPLNDKRQFQFCVYWDASVVCKDGLSDTNVCTYDYCSCGGVNLSCQAGTTYTQSCQCFVFCANDW
ncbi:hypothetical protein V8E51_007980 [Hyaloscypha variabilis]